MQLQATLDLYIGKHCTVRQVNCTQAWSSTLETTIQHDGCKCRQRQSSACHSIAHRDKCKCRQTWSSTSAMHLIAQQCCAVNSGTHQSCGWGRDASQKLLCEGTMAEGGVCSSGSGGPVVPCDVLTTAAANGYQAGFCQLPSAKQVACTASFFNSPVMPFFPLQWVALHRLALRHFGSLFLFMPIGTVPMCKHYYVCPASCSGCSFPSWPKQGKQMQQNMLLPCTGSMSMKHIL